MQAIAKARIKLFKSGEDRKKIWHDGSRMLRKCQFKCDIERVVNPEAQDDEKLVPISIWNDQTYGYTPLYILKKDLIDPRKIRILE